MSNQIRQHKCSAAIRKPYEDGQKGDLLNLLKQTGVNTCTMSINTSKTESNLKLRQTQIKKKSSIAASRLANKNRTLKLKSNTSPLNTQNTKYIKKSPQVSTSKGNSSIGFLTSASKELSPKLWLPTEIDSVVSPLTTLNGYSINSESVSSLTVKTLRNNHQMRNLQTTSWPSYTSLLAGTTAHEEELTKNSLLKSRLKTLSTRENRTAARLKRNKRSITPEDAKAFIPKSRKIKLLPSYRQARVLKDWCAAVRKTWNVALNAINTSTSKISETELRNRFVIKKHMRTKLKMRWVFRTPKRVREYAIKDLVASYRSGFTSLSRKRVRHFNIQPQTKGKTTISISHEMVRGQTDHTIRIGGMELRLNESIPKIEHNCRLVCDGNEFYLHVPYFLTQEELRTGDVASREDTVISVDPGIRKFLTFYNPRGECGTVGDDLKSGLEYRYRKIDSCRTKKRRRRLEFRLENWISDFQWKLCHWLLRKYRGILIPRLYVSKGGSVLNRRHMRYMKHCRFVDRLCIKALEYSNSVIYIGNEAWTSRQCGFCFNINGKSSSELFECRNCFLKMDRDVHSSRNIFLANVRELA